MRSFKYVVLFLGALLVLAASCHQKATPDSPEKLFEHYRKSVVLIRNQFYLKAALPDGRSGYVCAVEGGFTVNEDEARRAPLTAYGTGFFISEDGKIATNRHVAFPESEGKKMIEDMKSSIAGAIAAAAPDGRSGALADSIAEIANYIEEHADQLTDEELDRLNAQKQELEERAGEPEEGFDDEAVDGMKITAVTVAMGIAYDNTTVGNNDSYHPCVALDKSGTEEIDLAIIQLADRKTPDDAAVFTFEDHNPNVKNGTSEKDEAYDINKQLTIDKKLYMIGYNYGEEMANTSKGLKVQFTQGAVSQESDDYKVLYSIPSLPGSSGSPVIDQWGNLVAINFAGVKNSQSFNYGILAKHLKNMLMNVNAGSSEKKMPATADAGKDFEDKVRGFVNAEASRNFDAIYKCFAPNMRRYWDLNNPTREQLRSRYEHSWTITSEGKNEIQKIRRVDGYTYDLYAIYSYTNRKGESRQIRTMIRFEFDAYGKIVETYGR